jgi:hypothetical protein
MTLDGMARKIALPVVMAGLVLCLALACPAAWGQDLSGVYRVEGLDAGYRGTLTMRPAGATYLLEWRLTAGESYRGVALLTGNVLASNWVAGKTNGVVVYEIEPGGRILNGTYTSMNNVGVVQRERLTFLRR